jgi:hypothetical protein
MKKTLAVSAAVVAIMAANVYAGTTPGTGVLNSKHDINTTLGLVKDSQGRVCAFCHTPHHAVSLGGNYDPLWSHNPTGYTQGIPYSSDTFNAGQAGAFEPLTGPTRLCMSCHDGVVAPDQHYGTLFAGTTPTGRFAGDNFGEIAVGKGGDFSNDHPIGFKIADVFVAYGQLAADTGIYSDIATTRQWTKSGTPNSSGRAISLGFYVPAGSSDQIMTCATCHDVHNKDNVVNDATTGITTDANHVDTVQGNYFVYAPQSGSQLCTSCHNK